VPSDFESCKVLRDNDITSSKRTGGNNEKVAFAFSSLLYGFFDTSLRNRRHEMET